MRRSSSSRSASIGSGRFSQAYLSSAAGSSHIFRNLLPSPYIERLISAPSSPRCATRREAPPAESVSICRKPTLCHADRAYADGRRAIGTVLDQRGHRKSRHRAPPVIATQCSTLRLLHLMRAHRIFCEYSVGASGISSASSSLDCQGLCRNRLLLITMRPLHDGRRAALSSARRYATPVKQLGLRCCAPSEVEQPARRRADSPRVAVLDEPAMPARQSTTIRAASRSLRVAGRAIVESATVLKCLPCLDKSG